MLTGSPHHCMKRCPERSLCVKVPVAYVLCIAAAAFCRWDWGGGAGNFPLLAAAAAAGSFRTEVSAQLGSARLGSPSCSALRLGGADNTSCQSQLSRLGGAEGCEGWAGAFICDTSTGTSCVCVNVFDLRIYGCIIYLYILGHNNNISIQELMRVNSGNMDRMAWFRVCFW